MEFNRHPRRLWLLLSISLPLVVVVVAAGLVLRGERDAVLREARLAAQRACDEVTNQFLLEMAALAKDATPLPKRDEQGRFLEDGSGFLYPESPAPGPPEEAQQWVQDGQFARVLQEAPDARTPAGLPLAPLCAWHLMEQASERAELETAWHQLVSQAVELHPSAISPALLSKGERLLQDRGWSQTEIGSEPIWRRWHHDEELRDVIRQNEAALLRPAQGWIGVPASAWTYPAEPGGWRIGLARPVLDLCDRLVRDAETRLPPFATMRLHLSPVTAGKPVRPEERTLAATDRTIVRAVVSAAENGDFQLAVWQHARWIASALGLAFLVCATSGWQTLRAYRRQQELAERQSNFLSSVSHELRAPLASMRLMAESLTDGTVRDPGRVAEYHRVLHEESTRLCSLAENVLDMARMERGVKSYALAPCDVPALIQSATRILAPRAERGGVRFEVAGPSLDPPPLADEAALRQALLNLLDNALKHAPEGSVINIQTATLPPDRWSLSVTDQGKGIPESERERVFERFYRIGSELRRETTGAGLGLALVKHLAEAHGGTVEIGEGPGGGAQVILTLRLRPGEP